MFVCDKTEGINFVIINTYVQNPNCLMAVLQHTMMYLENLEKLEHLNA